MVRLRDWRDPRGKEPDGFARGLDHEFSQVAMKRPQPSTTSPTPSSPAHKKVKMSPNPFEVLVNDTEDGWTKVEKRKVKKAKKVEAKIDVCVSSLCFSSGPLQTNRQEPVVVVVEKAQPARFLYNSSEIIKRTHAAGINVRVPPNVPSVEVDDLCLR